MESDYSHHRLSVRVASRVAKLLKTYKISRKFQKYLELRTSSQLATRNENFGYCARLLHKISSTKFHRKTSFA